MTLRASPLSRHPSLVLVALVVASLAVAACDPDRDGPSATPAGTTAFASSAIPSASDDAATAGEQRSSVDAGTGADVDTGTYPGKGTRGPSAAIEPTPTAAPAAREPFAMNLATRDDFVAQYTFEWCVGASLQMAVNMSTDRSRTSKADQRRLWEMARDRSFSPFGGANPRGWTAALNDLGVGPYVLVSLPTFEAALDAAAEAIRATDRPVGLVMWRGRHAWVMSGFESRGDPRVVDGATITGIRVHDPLYPHGSSTWGKSPRPNSLISPATLARQFVLRDSRRVDLGVPPGFLLILPTVDEA
jgi:hypothetical protein